MTTMTYSVWYNFLKEGKPLDFIGLAVVEEGHPRQEYSLLYNGIQDQSYRWYLAVYDGCGRGGQLQPLIPGVWASPWVFMKV